jgi:hypothetical protein
VADLVVTCPKDFWREWIAEGDAAGDECHSPLAAGDAWAWYMGGPRPPVEPGERLYVVAWGRLRGYAPVLAVKRTERGWAILRRGGAVAVTIDEPVSGFRGWRRRWWEPSRERPFPDWRTVGTPWEIPSAPVGGLFAGEVRT